MNNLTRAGRYLLALAQYRFTASVCSNHTRVTVDSAVSHPGHRVERHLEMNSQNNHDRAIRNNLAFVAKKGRLQMGTKRWIIIERIEAQLAQLSIGCAPMETIHWIDDDDGDFCWPCARKKAAGRDTISGCCGYESDDPRYCELCGVELDISILSGSGELYHFSHNDPQSPSDWRILARLFDLYNPYLDDRNPYPWQCDYIRTARRKRTASLMWILRRVLPTGVIDEA